MIRPPVRSADSSTTTSRFLRSQAAASPAIPAPTITASRVSIAMRASVPGQTRTADTATLAAETTAEREERAHGSLAAEARRHHEEANRQWNLVFNATY